MSGDLISRKALLKEFDPDEENLNGIAARVRIVTQPIAFDADKVVSQINEIGKRYCNSVKCEKNCEDCEHGCLMRAIIGVVQEGEIKQNEYDK